MSKCVRFMASAFLILSVWDGGIEAQWSKQVSGTTLPLRDVVMLDSLTAICVGDSGRILKTTNAGLTWSTKHTGTQRWNAIAFVNAGTGFVVGNRGAVGQTTDRGETWIVLPQAGTGNLLTIAVVGMMSVFIGADNGSLIVSHDGGSTWSLSTFPGAPIRWIFGQRGDFGPVSMYLVTPIMPYKSSDLGSSWTAQPLPSPVWISLERGTFAPNATAFLVGSEGNPGPLPTLFRRRPTDTAWTRFIFMPPTPPCIVRDVSAPTNQVAYAGGTGGWMFKTVDGGSFWSFHTSGTRRNLNALDLLNERRGFVVGDSGTILFTANGGSDVNHAPQEFRLVQPADGDSMTIPRSITFVWQRTFDPDNDSVRYTLILSSDAGLSWHYIGTTSDTALQVQNSNLFGPGQYLWTVIASDGQATRPASQIFMFVIRRTVAVETSGREWERELELYQNYPNPFTATGGSLTVRQAGASGGNPSTTIKFHIPNLKPQTTVTLKVYDVLGREVATLVNEVKAPGEYVVQFSAKGGSASGGDGSNLPSGVYYYRLQSNGSIRTKKLILLK